MKTRFLRAFPPQVDVDAAVKTVSEHLDSTGHPFIVLVGVGDDIRVSAGPAREPVLALIAALETQGTLGKLATRFELTARLGKEEASG